LALPAPEVGLLATDLVVTLDRLPAVAVLPPTPAPRGDGAEVYRLGVWGRGQGLRGREALRVVPAADPGAPDVAPDAVGLTLWLVDERDGRILQIPAELLTTLRALRGVIRPRD
jgi:hypothetical protein